MPYDRKQYQGDLKFDMSQLDDLSKQFELTTPEHREAIDRILGRIIRQHQMIRMRRESESDKSSDFDMMRDNLDEAEADDVTGIEKDIDGYVNAFPHEVQNKVREICNHLKMNFIISSEELKRIANHLPDVDYNLNVQVIQEVNGAVDSQPQVTENQNPEKTMTHSQEIKKPADGSISFLGRFGMLLFSSKKLVDDEPRKSVEDLHVRRMSVN